MTVCEEKKYTAGLKRQANACPFVRPLAPFVGQNKPGIIPFVGHNQPSIVTGYRTAGFTLIELIVALSIAAILLALAAPNMSNFIRDHRLSGYVNDFISDLSYARSEAAKRGGNVAVCPGTSAGCVAAGNWANGRVVFVDADNGNDWDAGEIVLRLREVLDNDNTLNGGGVDMIVFANIGLLATGAGTFLFRDGRGVCRGRDVVIGVTGQTRIAIPGGC